MNRIHQGVLIFLANTEGKVLAQHRTDDAPIYPGLWGIPGGRIEPSEEPLEAAHRELLEETGLKVDTLDEFGVITRSLDDGQRATSHIFTGHTDAVQSDVVLGEGQAMVFLTPDEFRSKPLTWLTEHVLPDLLSSLSE